MLAIYITITLLSYFETATKITVEKARLHKSYNSNVFRTNFYDYLNIPLNCLKESRTFLSTKKHEKFYKSYYHT